MKTYIGGYYCRDELHLQIINKDSNRKILEALKDAYPAGLTVEELVKKTKLPMKTIYAQKAELYREYYINHLEEERGKLKSTRGRPPAASRLRAAGALRKRVRLVIEDATGLHDEYKGKKPIPLPPGNVIYSDGFTEACNKIVGKDEEEHLCKELLRFIQRAIDRIIVGYDDKNNYHQEEGEEEIKKRWAPETAIDFCCSQCGLNHEARDFIRAMLLYLIDQFERNDEFIGFLKDRQLLTEEAYERIIISRDKNTNTSTTVF
jgi:ribosomal protein L44E